jgi:hypothetical protein
MMIFLAFFLDQLLGNPLEGIMVSFRSRFDQLPE